MNDPKTPVSRLLRLLRDARERWKAKALERQKRLRAAQVRIRDLERSRAYWRKRALSAEGRATAGDASGAEADEDDGGEPHGAMVATRVANHRHSLEVIRFNVQLYLHAGLGYRGVGRVLRVLAGSLPPGVPAWTTVLNWCCRLG